MRKSGFAKLSLSLLSLAFLAASCGNVTPEVSSSSNEPIVSSQESSEPTTSKQDPIISQNDPKVAEEGAELPIPENTDLEFWVTQRPTQKDFEEKGCTFLPGGFGLDLYLDSRYTPAYESPNCPELPEIYVSYELTGYPDAIDNYAITCIEITDPSIRVYGLTMDSTDEEIDAVLSPVATMKSADRAYRIGNVTLSFGIGDYTKKISVSVPVSNNQGVKF